MRWNSGAHHGQLGPPELPRHQNYLGVGKCAVLAEILELTNHCELFLIPLQFSRKQMMATAMRMLGITQETSS